eukprot:7445561-Ditylum_brightwellii.AAC.1
MKEEDSQEQVNLVPRLHNNLYALKELSEAEAPPLRLLRGVATKDVQGIRYQVGVWGTTTSEQSSNFRELQNGVDALVEEGGARSLCGVK